MNLKINVSGIIEDCRSDDEQMEKKNKHMIKDALKTRQTTNNNECDIRDSKRKGESHSIKINTENSYGTGGAWLLRSNKESYSIPKKD